MIKYVVLAVVAAGLAFLAYRFLGSSRQPEGARSAASIYALSYTSIDGRQVSMEAYRGKKMLIVNVASECGFTPQYADLEKLYEEHKDKLVVIGFPANDFLGQEPGTDEQIAAFCKDKYDVTFPMSRKITVVGEGKDSVYKWLTEPSLNGWNSAGPKWNFHKYLVGETGELIAVFPSTTEPRSPEILGYLR